jgi:hypothetical protein
LFSSVSANGICSEQLRAVLSTVMIFFFIFSDRLTRQNRTRRRGFFAPLRRGLSIAYEYRHRYDYTLIPVGNRLIT